MTNNNSNNSMYRPESPQSASNLLEYVLSILFSVCSLSWAHLTDTDGTIFKLIIAPAVGGIIVFFVARFLKWLFPEKKS